MPDKWPLANGNWSNAANWNGGTLPVDGDDIFADNRTVTIDIDLNLPTARLWTTARSGGTAGGVFQIQSARNITLAAATAGTSTCLVVQASANFTGTTFQGNGTSHGLLVNNGTGVINFTNCTASGSTNGTGVGITIQQNYTFNGTLNLINALNSQGQALFNQSSSSVFTLTGNVQHGTGQTVFMQNFGSLTYTVLSETFVATSSTVNKISSSSNTGTVIWDRSGLPALNVPTVHVNYVEASGTGFFRYIGDVTPTTFLVNATFEHVGRMFGRDSNAVCQVTTNGDGIFLFDRIEANSVTGNLPFLNLRKVRPRNASSRIIARNQANTATQTLVDSTQVGDPPLQSNVRSGIVYNFGTLTGTCNVPPAESVAAGVPVDATVGTAVLTQAGVQAALTAAEIATRADVEDAALL